MGNMRLIDYSMYWLTAQNMDEIIVCYSTHDKVIKEYFEKMNYYEARSYEFVSQYSIDRKATNPDISLLR